MATRSELKIIPEEPCVNNMGGSQCLLRVSAYWLPEPVNFSDFPVAWPFAFDEVFGYRSSSVERLLNPSLQKRFLLCGLWSGPKSPTLSTSAL
jgi:hypothetical protein